MIVRYLALLFSQFLVLQANHKFPSKLRKYKAAQPRRAKNTVRFQPRSALVPAAADNDSEAETETESEFKKFVDLTLKNHDSLKNDIVNLNDDQFSNKKQILIKATEQLDMLKDITNLNNQISESKSTSDKLNDDYVNLSNEVDHFIHQNDIDNRLTELESTVTDRHDASISKIENLKNDLVGKVLDLESKTNEEFDLIENDRNEALEILNLQFEAFTKMAKSKLADNLLMMENFEMQLNDLVGRIADLEI